MADNKKEINSDIGEKLRIAREAHQLSVVDVSAALHITPTYVQLLENDQFDRLPGLVFARGYLKAYAKLVHLSADALLLEFDTLTESIRHEPIKMISRAKVYDVQHRTRLGMWLGVVGGCLVLLPSLIWWFGHEQTAQLVINNKMEKSTPTRVTNMPVTSVAAPSVEQSPLSAATASTITPLLQVTAGATTSIAEAVAGAQLTTVAIDAAQPSPTALPRGFKLLEVSFVEECWLQVTDKKGVILHEQVHRAGEKFSLSGEPPLRLWFGNVKGASLLFDGQPVALKAQGNSSSAKVVVGQ